MKIDQTELKNIINIYPHEKTSHTKLNCPSPKKLIALLRFDLSDRKRNKVIDRLAYYSTGAQEIKFINEILTAEKNFDKEAALIVTRRNQASHKKGIFKKSPFPKLSWNSMGVAAVITAIILSASLFFLIKTNKPAIERDSIQKLGQISPDNISLSLSELIFKWENIPDTEYNIVEISDDSSKIIWKSEEILSHTLVPPEELKELLKKGKTYLWMVTSYLTTGRQIESPLAKFKVK